MRCYLCHSSNLTVIREKLRHNVARKVLKCEDCGIVYLEPKKENLQSFYAEDYRKLHTPAISEVPKLANPHISLSEVENFGII